MIGNTHKQLLPKDKQLPVFLSAFADDDQLPGLKMTGCSLR